MHHESSEDGFDLIVLDYEMPHMNGIELAKHIRSIPEFEKTPLVILSSVDHSVCAVTKQEIGFSSVLLKPVRSEKLRSVVAHSLQKASAKSRKPSLCKRRWVKQSPQHIGCR